MSSDDREMRIEMSVRRPYCYVRHKGLGVTTSSINGSRKIEQDRTRLGRDRKNIPIPHASSYVTVTSLECFRARIRTDSTCSTTKKSSVNSVSRAPLNGSDGRKN